jgi:hypothetical protein
LANAVPDVPTETLTVLAAELPVAWVISWPLTPVGKFVNSAALTAGSWLLALS